MAVERGYLDYTTYRQDAEPYIVEMFDVAAGLDPEDPNNQIPKLILSEYDEILMEVRTKEDYRSKKVLGLSLSGGELTILNNNEIHFDLKNELAAKCYFYDMRFRAIGTNDWYTLVSGTLNNITNIGQV